MKKKSNSPVDFKQLQTEWMKSLNNIKIWDTPENISSSSSTPDNTTWTGGYSGGGYIPPNPYGGSFPSPSIQTPIISDPLLHDRLNDIDQRIKTMEETITQLIGTITEVVGELLEIVASKE